MTEQKIERLVLTALECRLAKYCMLTVPNKTGFDLRLPALISPRGAVKMRQIIGSSVADPDPGSNGFLTLDLGSAINIPDHISKSLLTIFWVEST
jgi:hypothetical protein